MAFDENRDGSGNRLLTGWKQVASYFGKDESTAKRWAAQRGLPIHRVPGEKRASVYAWSAELETWLRQQGDIPAEPASAVALPEPPAIPPAIPSSMPLPAAGRGARFAVAALAVAMLAAVAGIAAFGWQAAGSPGAMARQPVA